MKTTIYLEHRGSSKGPQDAKTTQHDKFYRVEDPEDYSGDVIVTWGPIGAKGQSKRMPKSQAEKKVAEKTAKGYVVIQKAGVTVEARPSGEGRRWGLEVETHSRLSPGEVADAMKSRGLKVNVEMDRYFKSDGKTWDVKRDGSCGYEFASPILSGKSGVFDSKVAVDKIREVCPTPVNSNCGIHVTIDVSDHSPTELRRLMIAYIKAQEYFYAECNDSRQNNRYCMRVGGDRIGALNLLRRMVQRPGPSETPVVQLMDPSNRYQGLNLTRLITKKIIEFRMLESSVAVRKVGAWIELCVGFVDGVKASNLDFNSTDAQPFTEEEFQTLCQWTKK